MADDSKARFDYENTLTVWKQYVDVRFKLLTLLPLATGIGVGVAADNLGARTAFVAAFVLVSIYGIVMYDMRNSLLHDAAIHRLKEIEIQLDLPKHTHTIEHGRGGLFNERPKRQVHLAGIVIWHDRALNIVYSSSFGAWATLLAASLADVFEWPASDDDRWLVAIVGGIASAVGAHYTIDRADDEATAIQHRMGKQ